MSSSIINLESLLELGGRLMETADEEFILNSALLSLMGKMRILRGCALKPSGGAFTVALAKGRVELTHVPAFDIDDAHELTAAGEKPLADAGYRYIVPVRYHNEVFAALCLGTPATAGSDDLRYMSLVGTIAANAIQNARAKQSLLLANAEIAARNLMLTSLFETAREFSAVLRRDEILRMLSYRLMGQTMVSRFALFVQNAADDYEPAVNRLGVDVPAEIIEELLNISSPSISDYRTTNPATESFLARTGIQVVSLMKVYGEIKGLLLISGKLNGGEFTRDDLHFIEALGNTAIAALENARLFAEEVEKQRLENELHLAKDIQRQLLPEIIPDMRGYDIAGENISSKQVGGDYFDVVQLDAGRLLIAIADVSGKGIPAALIMANAQAALRALAPLELPLPEFVTRINTVVHANTRADKFVTFFCGILDVRSGLLRYINAGHNPPLLRRAGSGQLEELGTGGIVLGILDPAPPFDEGTAQFDAGDALILYTDGVSEAMNVQSEEFGEPRLQALAAASGEAAPAGEIVRTIISAVQQHAAGAPQSDDITLLVVRRTE